jgi:hypothetical protein
VQRNGTAAGLPFTSAVRHVHDLRDVPGRIGDHGPGQRGHLFGAEAGLERQQEHDPVARGIAGGGQVAQNRPLLGRTDNLGLLPLHRGTPVGLVFALIR